MGNALRRPVLELGRRLVRSGALAAPEDVFFLHVDEIAAGLSGVDQQVTAAARQADLRRWEAVVPAETLGVAPAEDVGDFFLAAMSKQDTTPDVGCASRVDGELVIAGSPGAPGVARSLAKACGVHAGEVLVCEMSLPTCTPVFATIAAVVADTGGLLSHSAIVAREQVG